MENDTIVVETSKRTIGKILVKTAALAAIVGAGFVLVNRALDNNDNVTVQS